MTMATRAPPPACGDQRFAPLPITAALASARSASRKRMPRSSLFASSAVDAASFAVPHGACAGPGVAAGLGDAELDGGRRAAAFVAFAVGAGKVHAFAALRAGTGCASPSAIPSRAPRRIPSPSFDRGTPPPCPPP